MTESELKQYFIDNYPKENEIHEWKDFSNLNNTISGKQSEYIISYISCIANHKGGVLIIEIEDITHNIIGIKQFGDYTLENIKP